MSSHAPHVESMEASRCTPRWADSKGRSCSEVSMFRHQSMLILLLFACPVWTQENTKTVAQPRVDKFGDPLPTGALRRLGTVRFRQQYVHDMAFLPDGKSLLVESTGRLVQWDVATGKPLRTIPTSEEGNWRSLGLSRDGGLVAYRPDRDQIVVLDLATVMKRIM